MTARRAYPPGARRCLVCGSGSWLDPHHVVPRSRGGSDEPDNLVWLCRQHHAELHALIGQTPSRSLLRRPALRAAAQEWIRRYPYAVGALPWWLIPERRG